jgi:hypothetical protein
MKKNLQTIYQAFSGLLLFWLVITPIILQRTYARAPVEKSTSIEIEIRLQPQNKLLHDVTAGTTCYIEINDYQNVFFSITSYYTLSVIGGGAALVATQPFLSQSSIITAKVGGGNYSG